jgi:hypothetical protein
VSEQARVLSIDDLKQLRTAIAIFREEAQGALSAADMEIRRTQDRLTHEMPNYWQRQLREWNERVAIAKSELARKRLQGTPDCPADTIDQEKALRIAKARVEEAEEKVVVVQRCERVLSQAAQEYQGFARRLDDFVRVDLDRAMTLLANMAESLDAYAADSPGISELESASAARAGLDSSPSPIEQPSKTSANDVVEQPAEGREES